MKNWLWIGGAASLPVPWIYLKFSGFYHTMDPVLVAFTSGIAIVGAAFLLCWAAEVAQKDISKSFALALLALIAVLPEYVVDLYFAWMGGKDPSYIPYATANMTGANRLLIGIGWSAVVFLYCLKNRKRVLEIERSHRIEFSFLVLATLYSFVIPIKGTLSILDAVVLLSLFVLYMVSVSRAKVIEPELVGPALTISVLSVPIRRLLTVAFFIYAGFSILIAAEPFAEGLIQVGKRFGIEEFILVQWLAPLASESPEMIVACLFVLNGKAGSGMGALISSKVNQWTLLIGLLPVVFSISAGSLSSMVLDGRQVEEIFLTGAQSAFGAAVLASLSLSIWEALSLFLLFSTQLIFPVILPSHDVQARYLYAWFYIGLAIIILLRDFRGRILKGG